MTGSASLAYVKALCLCTGPIWQPAVLDSCSGMDASPTEPSRFSKDIIGCKSGDTSNSVRMYRASEIPATTGIAGRLWWVLYAQTFATDRGVALTRNARERREIP